MNKAQQLNLAIQRLANTNNGGGLLPPEYQQVEYLQSTGRQRIDTGVYNTAQFDFYIKLSVTYNTDVYGTSNYIFGTFATTSGRCLLSFNNTNGTMGFGYTTSGKNDGTLSESEIHEVTGRLKNGDQYLDIDGVRTITLTNSGIPSPSHKIPLYCGWHEPYFSETNHYQSWLHAKVYRVTFTSDSGDILDYVPCYRKSDNKPGMYDLVTNTFYINNGSGEFTVGPNI